LRIFLLFLVLSFLPSVAVAAEEAPDLRRHLERAAVGGVIALYDPDRGRLRVSDLARARTAYIPASTFKVPAALIALDLGIVRDPRRDIFPYGGEPFFVESCNRDQTLETALQRSCVPVFASLARAIGDERLSAGLRALGFGNAATPGTFPYWLRGGMRITPLEQITFMDRLRSGSHPVTTAAQREVAGMIEIERQGDFVIRGKTGWSTDGNGIGWLVGWAEKGGETRVFAVNIEMKRMAEAPLRLKIAKAVLAEEGLAP
jgi:beta-lactamase class D